MAITRANQRDQEVGELCTDAPHPANSVQGILDDVKRRRKEGHRQRYREIVLRMVSDSGLSDDDRLELYDVLRHLGYGGDRFERDVGDIRDLDGLERMNLDAEVSRLDLLMADHGRRFAEFTERTDKERKKLAEEGAGLGAQRSGTGMQIGHRNRLRERVERDLKVGAAKPAAPPPEPKRRFLGPMKRGVTRLVTIQSGKTEPAVLS